MKAITIQEAEGQLGRLVAQACRGEVILLTDGENKVSLEPHAILDLDEDSPELEAELLKAVQGPHSPLRDGELREIADRAMREHRLRRQA